MTNAALPPVACVILAAGQGTRMKSDLPKVLHPVANWPMIRHVTEACKALQAERIVVVIASDAKAVQEAVAPIPCAVQPEAKGTGDATKAAAKELKDFRGDILVLCGDNALVTPEALQQMRDKRAETGAAVVVAGFEPQDNTPYGRLIRDQTGLLKAIVEAKDAMEEQKAIRQCNAGIMLFDSAHLWSLLEKLQPNNAKKEYYLTDTVELARKQGLTCAVAMMAEDEVCGINTRVELAEAEQLMQQRLRRRVMLEGATLLDPATTYLSADTKIGRDVVIGPNVFIGPGVEIADRVTVHAFCYLEQAKVESGAQVGPFARLRPGTLIGEQAKIGNFVEIKNSSVGKGAKVPHLSYMGDANIGAKANIGAGTITCNYDGFRKSHTHIGVETFIGSNSALVAPVSVGDGAYVGAGSVITIDVPANTLAVARGRQSNIEDWARRYREEQVRRQNEK